MSRSIFGKSRVKVGLEALLVSLQDAKDSGQLTLTQSQADQLQRHASGLESLAMPEFDAISSKFASLNDSLESMLLQAKVDGVTPAQREAALGAIALVSNITGHLSADLNKTRVSTESMRFVDTASTYGVSKREFGLESYNESNVKDVAAFTVAYNLSASRQDEFGEAFFPGYTVAPDQFGFSIELNLVQVFKDYRHSLKGEAIGNFGRRQLLHAFVDPSILENESTLAVPVVRPENKANFVDEALVPSYPRLVSGIEVPTAPIAFGKRTNLLSLSITDALAKTGALGYDDVLDGMAQLEAVYLEVPSADGTKRDVIRIEGLRNMQGAMFTKTVQGTDRQMGLTFDVKQLLVSGLNTKRIDKSELVVLKALKDNKLSLRLGSFLNGTLQLNSGDLLLSATDVELTYIEDEKGERVPTGSGVGKELADLIKNARLIGYDIYAHRANMNARQRGSLLDTSKFSMTYSVPLLGPISVLRSTQVGPENDANNLNALIMATHARASGDAVLKLFDVASTLHATVSHVGGLVNDDPETFGITRKVLTPFYEYKKLNIPDRLSNQKAHEWSADVQATIVNYLRDVVYRAYRDSIYKVLADAMAGGVAPTPTVIIGTDPVTARYIMVDSDFRTLGNDFNVKVVTTNNKDMRGKIFMAFGVFDGSEGTPNPLHFGNFIWKPEVVMDLQVTREGGTNRELIVAPSYLHVVNVPILMEVDIDGLHDAVSTRQAILFEQKK